jgi:hypothetical protein
MSSRCPRRGRSTISDPYIYVHSNIIIHSTKRKSDERERRERERDERERKR